MQQFIGCDAHKRFSVFVAVDERGNATRPVRILREDNLLAFQPKCFKVTTNSNHKWEIYLNLAARLKLTGINQLWVADITYIRLKAELFSWSNFGTGQAWPETRKRNRSNDLD